MLTYCCCSHEIVEEFKDLVSASVGDDDDRYVSIKTGLI